MPTKVCSLASARSGCLTRSWRLLHCNNACIEHQALTRHALGSQLNAFSAADKVTL